MTELLSALPVTPALARRLEGRPLVLMLDIDGTLAPIAPRPEYAVVPLDTKKALCDLVAIPSIHVALITGRGVEDARRMVAVEAAWLIGNHGIETAAPGEPPRVRADVAPYEALIAEAKRRAEWIAATKPGVLVEDKRWTLSVHYRLMHPRLVPELTAEIHRLGEEVGLRVTAGKEVLELRPPVAIDKGVAAVDLAQALGAFEPGASLLCAGDDRTDEDAFRALRAARPDAVTIRVGDVAETAAEFSIPDTSAMRELLAWLLATRQDTA